MTKQDSFYVVGGSFPIRDLGFAKAQAVRMAIESQRHVRVENSKGHVVAQYDRKGNRACIRCGTTKVKVQSFPGEFCPTCDVIA